jgi:hypothetical protein
MKTSLFLLLAIFVFVVRLHSQDVPPVSIVNGSIPISSTFQAQVDTNRLPFIFGWNWGPGLQKSNLDLHINVFHIDNPWTWSTPPLNATEWNSNFKEINKTPFGTRLIFSPGNNYGNTATYNTQFP